MFQDVRLCHKLPITVCVVKVTVFVKCLGRCQCLALRCVAAKEAATYVGQTHVFLYGKDS